MSEERKRHLKTFCYGFIVGLIISVFTLLPAVANATAVDEAGSINGGIVPPPVANATTNGGIVPPVVIGINPATDSDVFIKSAFKAIIKLESELGIDLKVSNIQTTSGPKFFLYNPKNENFVFYISPSQTSSYFDYIDIKNQVIRLALDEIVFRSQLVKLNPADFLNDVTKVKNNFMTYMLKIFETYHTGSATYYKDEELQSQEDLNELCTIISVLESRR